MSLDIALVPRRPGAGIDLARVQAACATHSHCDATSGEASEWSAVFRDPATASRWVLQWRHGDLLATVEHARPSFFGEQAVDEISALAESLDLAPFLDGSDVDSDTLLETWTVGNVAAVRALEAQGQTVPFMPPDKAHAWWEYTRARDSLSALLGEGVFVPNVVLVLGPKGTTVERLVSWPDAIPAVLPATEHVVLLRSSGRSVPPFTARLATGSGVAAALADLLVPAPAAVQGLRMLPPECSEAAAARLARVPSRPMRAFTAVQPDGFVDVR